MRKIILCTVLIVLSLGSFAQTGSNKISGSVKDNNGKIMEAATVSLLQAKNSSLVKVNAANKAGRFSFEGLLNGRYLVSVSAIGHNIIYSETASVANSSVVLKEMILVPAATSLAGVTVVAKKPLIEQKPGMTILNVDASPTNAGQNALELLEKSPGVTIDNDGNISLKGKAGVLILIDGKPTYMSPTDLAAFLKNMQSNNLSQIEIMTSPPAKYDAAGNSGIINIKTKKGTIKGMNGSANVNYNQGYYGSFHSGLNLNYRNNNLNIFGNANAGDYRGINRLNIDRTFYNGQRATSGFGDQVTNTTYHGQYQSVKAGIDYTLGKKDVVGVVVNGNFGVHRQKPLSNSNVRDANNDVVYRLHSNSNNNNNNNNVSANANYKHSFDSTGRELTADVDYIYYSNKSSNNLVTESFNADDVKTATDVTLKGFTPSRINIYSGKLDYVHPFKGGLKLESGLKTSLVNTDNMVNYERNNGTGWFVDDRSNHFVYNENINAAYAIVSKKIKKWDLTAGLRMENTVAKGRQIKNDSTFKRNYTNLFPNAGVGFSVNDKNQLNFSYSRRINRPDYDALNPFVYFLDSLTYGQGNPYLQPQFTQNLELSHTYNKFLTTTINFSRTTDVIADILKQDSEKRTTYQTKDNFSSLQQLGLAVSAQFKVVKRWSINVYGNVFNNKFNGIYLNDPVQINFTSFTSNITNSIDFGKGWKGEVSGWYRSKGVEDLLVINNMGAINAALSKQVLKNMGTIKIGVRDMLRTQNFSGYAKYSDVNVNLSGRRDSRQLNVSLNIRFGNAKIPGIRKQSGGAGDEQNRVKTGGGN